MINDFHTSILRGRAFSDSDLSLIKSCISENYELGRTRISQEVCKILDWRQPNGWLKDRACRDVLRTLEERGVIGLPPSLIQREKKERVEECKIFEDQALKEFNLVSPIFEFPQQIHLEFAKGNKNERVWNALIEKYHYLGHQVTVGRAIKYLIFGDKNLIGAISFSSASWHLTQRDALLTNLGIKDPLDYVINNSRFLILPTVKVKNLASSILGLATKQVSSDWLSYYSIQPLIAETFVQPSLYKGTCYQAANWLKIGTTKGYAKKGSSYHNSQEPKLIFLYGLNKKIRRELYKIIPES